MSTNAANLPGPLSALSGRGEQIIHQMAALLVTIAIAFLGLISIESWHEERSVALENLTSIAEIEARAIDIYFNRIELDLLGLSEELTTGGTAIDLDSAYTRLVRFKTLHPEFYNVTLLSPTGDVLVSANSAPKAVVASVAGQASFQTSLAELRAGAAVSVGQPFFSVLSGTAMVPIRHAIRGPQGELSFIVSANLPHEYLRNFWIDTPIAKRAAIGLLRDDGYLLSRYPVPIDSKVEEVYKKPRTGALIQFLRDNNYPVSGNVDGESSLDGPDRLNVFRRLPTFPVTLFVALPLSEVWASWWHEMRKTFLQTALVFALGIAAYLSAIRQQRRWREQTNAAGDALRESEARWEFALEGAGEGVWDWDLTANKVTVSRVYQEIFGLSMPSATQQMTDWTNRLHPDDVEGARAKFQGLLDGVQDGYVDEHRERCADGSWKWVQVRGMAVARDPDGRLQRVIGTVADISERRAHDESLRILEACVAHTNDIVVITEAEPLDERGPRISFVNDALLTRTGYTRDEVIGRTPRMFQGPQTDRATLDRIRVALSAWQPVRAELINYTKAGEPYWLELDISPIANATGRFTHWVAIERDVTERKRAEEAIRLSERRFRVAIKALQEGFVLQNRKAEILVCNTSAARILGLSADQMMGRTSLDPRWRAIREDGSIFSGDAHPAVVTLRDGTPQTNVVMGIDKADGSRTWISINTAPVFDDETRAPSGVVETFVDITGQVAATSAKHNLEQQLREAQKMESLGTLAGGIAHDFNNILGAIVGNVSLAEEDAADNQPVKVSLNEITKAARRAKTLIDQILTFSRRQTQDLNVQPLLPLINEAVGLLRATIPPKTILETTVEAADVNVRCNASQISQVLLNMCTNSWHALPDGIGKIVVSLSEVNITRAAQPCAQRMAPGTYACISVQDNGAGMDAATQARIFEPFFTTKPVGVGTGLGLAVVHGIVTAHGGYLQLKSEVGVGTRFDIYLPAIAGAAAALTSPLAPEKAIQGSGQHVVYIDDDEAMVLLTVRVLEKRGFRASGYLSAARALEAIQKNPDDVDLVVSDYNMPGQSGLDVARSVKRLRADLPMIITSGYITDELRTAARSEGIRDLVYKPNTVEELVQAIVRSL